MSFRFLIDADDVLAHCLPRVIDILSEAYDRPWTLDELPPNQWDIYSALPKQVETYLFKRMSEPGFCYSFESTPGSLEFIQALRGLGGDIKVVTAPFDGPTWTHERIHWLKAYFEIPHQDVVSTGSKHVCVGDYFLDDCPQNVLGWAKAHRNGVAMLWNTPQNLRVSGPHDEYRVESWEDVLQHIPAMHKK